jgi:hypothetical protein
MSQSKNTPQITRMAQIKDRPQIAPMAQIEKTGRRLRIYKRATLVKAHIE